MRVLMLGWEFPPFITGGLGTACYGLTKALVRRGVEVTFILPKSVEGDTASHVRLLSPDRVLPALTGAGVPPVGTSTVAAGGPGFANQPGTATVPSTAAPGNTGGGAALVRDAHRVNTGHARFIELPMHASSSYAPTAGAIPGLEMEAGHFWAQRERTIHTGSTTDGGSSTGAAGGPWTAPTPHDPAGAPGWMAVPPPLAPVGADYGGDLMDQVHRYAHFALAAARREQFDVIHAHDWLTYPAGMWIARMSGKPLVVHVHSTEFDRSGLHVNQPVYDIERRGMHAAMLVIAVSQLTKNTIVARYGVHPDKVEVVYNGVDLAPTQATNIGIESRDKIVLYFGRITMQKGPEYFIRAAKRVLEYMDDVKFVVAGNGDQAARMIEMAAELGIGHKVLFTGFLRGADIHRVFALADLYVMPSVSEPFGIAPLEAMGHDVPVIISKSSGVSEVLTHALKVDFWDVDDIANKIIAVLKYPPLQRTLREHGAFEVRKLTWDGAANRCEQIYRASTRRMGKVG